MILNDYTIYARVRERANELQREAEKERLLRQIPRQPSQWQARYRAGLQTAQATLSGIFPRRQPAAPVVIPNVLCCEPCTS